MPVVSSAGITDATTIRFIAQLARVLVTMVWPLAVLINFWEIRRSRAPSGRADQETSWSILVCHSA